MQLIPFNDRIIVRPVGREKFYGKSQIIIPDTVSDRPTRGTVVAVGPGVLNEDGTRTPLQAREGDDIYYGKFAGTEFTIDGVQHLLIREVDIICSIQSDAETIPGSLRAEEVTPVSIEYTEDM